MVDRHDNVIALPPQARPGSRPLTHDESLRDTIKLLEKLGYHLQQISSRPSWSAQRWMIASTPFRMRLAAAREKLSVLGRISSAAEEHDICWAFELDRARFKAERRSHDIDVCLHALQYAGISHAERIRQTEIFTSNRSELLELLGRIRHLLDQRLCAIQDEPLGDGLRDIAERLRGLVDACQECPGELDSCLLGTTGRALDVEAMITEVYRIVENQACAEDGALRADYEAWEAFNDQKDEFLDFYRTALNALDTYKTVLHAYSLINDGKSRPRRGDLERVRRDKHALVKERDLCVEAIRNFHGKFSGMLSIF